MTEAATRLGPRAREAVARCIETAITAGRSTKGVVPARHVEHAIASIETSMIVDAVEGGAAELRAELAKAGG
ncbi:hypothetical protein [Falsiroseomonas sp.]|uniref:hypothetical protein n=1 Tax=Falsiroseomonas sp. TaxID=2870721 RepID=UPI003F6F8BDE